MPEPSTVISPAMSNLRRRSLLVIALLTGIYALGFLVTWPTALLVSDEALYVNQAELFAEGTTRWAVPDAITSEPSRVLVSDYPPGTSLLQAPLVRIGGWRAAAVISVAALVATALVLRRWLEREGRSPWFALLLLVHPIALVMGRIAMSDAPSMLVMTSALSLFWSGLPTERPDQRETAHPNEVPTVRRWAWPAAGFLTGLAVLLREPNVLVMAPFVVGALVRRDRFALRLLVGVLAGGAVRLGVSAVVFGDPLHVRAAGEYRGLQTQLEALGLIALALVVMVPGGLIAVAIYHGRRRVEVMVTVALVVGFFTFYGYSAAQSGILDRLVLTPRFVLPVLPLVVFAAAETMPRLLDGTRRRRASIGDRRSASALVAALVVAAIVGSVGAHAAVAQRSRVDARVVAAIAESTPSGARLVVNSASLTKYLGPVAGAQPWVDRTAVPAIGLPSLLIRKGPVYLVFLDRSDSAFRNEEAASNAAYLDAAGFWCDLTPRFDDRVGNGLRLRILEARLR